MTRTDTVDLVTLEELRNLGNRRLTGVETVRAASKLGLRLDLMAGTCSIVGTSQEGRTGCTHVAVFTTEYSDRRRLHHCTNCATRALHMTAAQLRGAKAFGAASPA